jgi:hypothetical protein
VRIYLRRSIGNRHDLSLALGGTLARAGWDIAAIEPFVGAIVAIANDPHPAETMTVSGNSP